MAAEAREDTVLTLEPHLAVFDNLNTLQAEELRHRYAYPDAKTAFAAAAEASPAAAASSQRSSGLRLSVG